VEEKVIYVPESLSQQQKENVIVNRKNQNKKVDVGYFNYFWDSYLFRIKA
jgi:hypothetical protein